MAYRLRKLQFTFFNVYMCMYHMKSALNYVSSAPDMQYIHIQNRRKVLYVLYSASNVKESPLPHIYTELKIDSRSARHTTTEKKIQLEPELQHHFQAPHTWDKKTSRNVKLSV